jgi:hypothetical protein
VRAAEASRDGATRQPRFSLTPVIEQFADDRLWHIPEVPALLVHVGCWGKTGRHLLAMSSSHFDPKPT